MQGLILRSICGSLQHVIGLEVLPEWVGGIGESAVCVCVRRQQVTEFIVDPRFGNGQPRKQDSAESESQGQDYGASEHLSDRQPLVAADQPRHNMWCGRLVADSNDSRVLRRHWNE